MLITCGTVIVAAALTLAPSIGAPSLPFLSQISTVRIGPLPGTCHRMRGWSGLAAIPDGAQTRRKSKARTSEPARRLFERRWSIAAAFDTRIELRGYPWERN
jgi:hypothetical protein